MPAVSIVSSFVKSKILLPQFEMCETIESDSTEEKIYV